MTPRLRPMSVLTAALAGACLAGLPMPAAALGEPAAAGPQFARVFGDHAVLQRGGPIHVWGTGAGGEAVTVTLDGQDTVVQADALGNWSADLPAPPAGGPYSLQAANALGSTTLSDVLVGDVFLCGGQSNMEFPVKFATNAWNEVGASANANLRFINIARDSAAAPLHDLSTSPSWEVAGPDTTGDASAVCYYMSKAIQKEQGVPVGFIDSYWGGTVIEAWISSDSLRQVKGYDRALDALAGYARDPVQARADWARATRDSWQASEPDVAAKLAWIDPKFKDADWKTITPDTPWENSGDPALASFDGIVWYRQSVTLTPAQARQAATISLGPVDDADITWVNGVMVGNTYGWDTPRDYVLPAGTLRAGANIIVVRALDSGGGGGLYGKPADRRLAFADGTSLTLPAQWKYRISGAVVEGAEVLGEPWASPNGLTNLYDAMIAPLAPYTLKGVAWYQGEANVNSAARYATLLPALMQDWRRKFQNSALPFLVVQLSGYGPVATAPGPSGWAELRESQRRAVDADPHAGLVVSTDFGDRTDIHPTEKTVIGNRLARAARVVVYGEDMAPGGPEAASVTRSGGDIEIGFRHAEGGLVTYSSSDAIAFEVCTAPDVCAYAPGTVAGDTVVLKGASAPGVKSVRYAWADSPITNLYGQDDLPAVPFSMEIGQ